MGNQYGSPMSDLAATPSAADAPAVWSPPYPPSWVDRLVARIVELPLAGWWLYPLMVGALLGYVNVVRWVFGSVPVATVDLAVIPLVVYGPFALAMVQYLDDVAAAAFETFRPALGLPDGDIETLRYELVTLPAAWVRPAAVVGAVMGALTVILAPQSIAARFGSTSAEVLVAGGPATVFGYTLFAIFIAHTIRQLRSVARIHRDARRLDLYDDGPLYAFSRLTVRTGLAYLAAAYFTLVINGGSLAGDPVSLGASVVVVAVAIACFILPLQGIHGRLVTEKARLMEAANRRLLMVTDELYRRMDTDELAGIADLNSAMSGVTAVRERVLRLPTWPWPPQVLRGFVTALLIPVVIWFVTQRLGVIVK